MNKKGQKRCFVREINNNEGFDKRKEAVDIVEGRKGQ